MKKIVRIYTPIFLLLIFLWLVFQPNPFFRNAIIYTTADIDDYKLFENRVVKAGQHQPWKIAEGFNQYNLRPDDITLLKKFQTTAYLIVKDTALLFEFYDGQFTDSTLSNSFSMAKSIVSLLIGIAIDEGKINSVNDPIHDYLPEFNPKNNNSITISHLLTMSSGLKWNESYYNPFSVTTKAYYGNNLKKLVLKTKSKEKPGVKFEYLTANTQLLAIILEKVTQKTLSEYASEKLWQPLGAKYDALWSLDQKNGIEKAYCCFNSNARDFARIGQLILNNGKWGNQQIISPDYLAKALTPASYLIDDDEKPVDFYGFQWWIGQHNDSIFYYARGILGQYIIAIPSENMVVVRLGHQRSRNRVNHHPEDIFDYIDLAIKISN
ncbi:MAG: serine hydrolase [Bacteroidales bacterium]